MRLPNVPPRYTPDVESDRNRILVTAELTNRKTGQDVDMAGGDGTRVPRLILVAPNGSRWSVLVSNTGTLSTVAL